MKEYLTNKSNIFDKELISIIDELPLWAAPFGLSLLDKIKIGKKLTVLDIGFGTGFPLIEIAQRLGETSLIYGIDPWKEAADRAQLKITKYGINNLEMINGHAEKLPFDDSFFDVIVSNNRIIMLKIWIKHLRNADRASRKGAQLLFTMNLDSSMMEFYNVLKDELEKENDKKAIEKMKMHIYEKRRPLNEIKQVLNKNAYNINEISENKFYIRFADASAMFKH